MDQSKYMAEKVQAEKSAFQNDPLLGEMTKDGWKKEYVEALITHRNALAQGGVRAMLPKLLNFDDGTLLDIKKVPFGGLRNSGGVVQKIEEYIDSLEKGAADAFSNWAGNHSGNSDNLGDYALKAYWAWQRELKLDYFYWGVNGVPSNVPGSADKLKVAAQVWHAFTIDLLNNCAFPRNDRKNKVVTLFRAVSSDVKEYKPGAFDACSMVNVASVGAGKIMQFVVPHHNVWCCYFPTRIGGIGGRGFFKQDEESEFLVFPEANKFPVNASNYVIHQIPAMPNKYVEATDTWEVEKFVW